MKRRARGGRLAHLAWLLVLATVALALFAWQAVTRAPWDSLLPEDETTPPTHTASLAAPPTATEPILPAPPTNSAPVSSPLATSSAPIAATASPALIPGSTPTLRAATASATVAFPSPAPSVTPPTALNPARARLGVGASSQRVTAERAESLGLGWYLDWAAHPDAHRSSQVEYVPMVRVREGELWPNGERLLAAVDAMPGALWLIGNEPDVRWQDNTPPEAYAAAYHEAYTLLKERDPSCQVAIGGVSQPTPLRLRYLDRVLMAYETAYGEPMPVDVWNVHNFILREERNSWGVDIPPDMDEQAGRLYEIADHDDLEVFYQQIVDFRRWMKARGQQDKPLIVSEYGILMPAEYGFPPDQVERFMLDTFEIMRTTADPALGYPADDHRLVQRWCWFSLSDARYPTGDLLTPDGNLTRLGQAFAAYVISLR